jgi:hypothetical protein
MHLAPIFAMRYVPAGILPEGGVDCQYRDADWSAMLIAPSLPMNEQELWSQSSIPSWDTRAKEGVLMKCPRYG